MAETPKRVWSNKKIVRQGKKQVWLKDDELTTYDSSWGSVDEDTPLSTYGNSWENLSGDDKLEVYGNSEEEIGTVDDYIGGDKVTARFLNYDGTVLKTEKVESGETPTAPADPTRPASAEYTYTFTGRDPVVGPITEDTDYTAQYEATPIPSDSFRYIRWTLTASQDLAMSNEVQVGELTFTDGVNDMARPVGTLVTCNKETWGDGAAENLIDGQSTTKFGSDAGYPYVVTFDLGSGNSINPSVYDKYTWNQAFDSVGQALRNPSAWTMEFSKDGIAWETWGSESNIMIDDPEDRGLEGPFDLEKVTQYTVTIVSNDTDYGTVDESELIVNSGTSLSAVSNVLSVGSTEVTATAESGYEFVSWTVAGESLPATVTDDITITATFQATLEPIVNAAFLADDGSDEGIYIDLFTSTLSGATDFVELSILTDEETGDTSINVAVEGIYADSRLEIDGTNVFVSLFENYSDSGYYDSLAQSGTAGDTGTITSAFFTALQNLYENPTAENLAAAGTILAGYAITEPMTMFVTWTTPYTVTIQSNDTSLGTVDESEVTVASGTSMSAVSNVLTIGTTDVTATPETGCDFTSWTVGGEALPATVTENITVTATFTAGI